MNPESRPILVVAFLLVQALVVHWIGNAERPPGAPDLTRFPTTIGEWKALREDPVDPDVAAELRADRLLSRTYLRQPGGVVVSLFVAWFRSQRAGTGQPHSPKVCLPAAGWVMQAAGRFSQPTASGVITINRYVASRNGVYAEVLYWYQMPRRVVASEWAAKFWLIADAVRDRRTDTALVRLVRWQAAAADSGAGATAADFAGSVYPLLVQALPQ